MFNEREVAKMLVRLTVKAGKLGLNWENECKLVSYGDVLLRIAKARQAKKKKT